MIDNPIFIVGTERSGSNLLRLILNEHEAISIPHPPHLMKDIHPHISRYGELSSEANFRRLIRHSTKLVELHFMPWEIRIDEDRVFAQAHERSLYAVYVQLYEQYLEASGKRRWGCKSTFMIRHVEEICHAHRNPRFIHLVRDGRDVAVSARNSVFNRYHPHYVSKLWSEEQRLAISLRNKLSPRVFQTFRYESLISEPEACIREICSFLGEEFSPELLHYFKGPTAGRLASMSRSWKNCDKPIEATNFGKYRERLSSAEIFEFERISHRELAHFGYAVENGSDELDRAAPSSWRLLGFWFAERARAAKVELTALFSDRNAFLRLRKRFFIQARVFFLLLP